VDIVVDVEEEQLLCSSPGCRQTNLVRFVISNIAMLGLEKKWCNAWIDLADSTYIG
jgi:hypothetical protein